MLRIYAQYHAQYYVPSTANIAAESKLRVLVDRYAKVVRVHGEIIVVCTDYHWVGLSGFADACPGLLHFLIDRRHVEVFPYRNMVVM